MKKKRRSRVKKKKISYKKFLFGIGFAFYLFVIFGLAGTMDYEDEFGFGDGIERTKSMFSKSMRY